MSKHLSNEISVRMLRALALVLVSGATVAAYPWTVYMSDLEGDWAHVIRYDTEGHSGANLGQTIAYLGSSMERMDDGRLLGYGFGDPQILDPEIFDYQVMPGVIVGPATNQPGNDDWDFAEYQGRLYGITASTSPTPTSDICEINPLTGEFTLLAHIDGAYVPDLAINESGMAYAISHSFESGQWVGRLNRIDINTGSLTPIATTEYNIGGIDFAPDGTLFALERIGSGFGTINLSTGQYTRQFTIPFAPGEGRAITVVVPEPATGIALLAGLVVLGFRSCRRHRIKHR